MNASQIQPAQKLTNLQLELLKLYAKNVPEEDLLMIKKILAQYFLKKSIQEANNVWDAKAYTNELMEEWRSSKDLRK